MRGMNKVKLLLIADQEGCIGIYNSTDSASAGEYMQKEVSCIIDRLLEMQNYSITVLDCHNRGDTLNPLKSIYSDVKFIHQIWNFDESEHFDMAMLIGFHTMAGTNGILPHSFRPEIVKVFLHDKVVGEIGILANWLSYLQIPLLLVSGDLAIEPEVKELGCKCVAVKNSGETFSEDKNKEKYGHLLSSIAAILKEKPHNKTFLAGEIRIKLKNDSFLEYLPPKLFNAKEGFIVFKNVKDFIKSLYELSLFISTISNIFSLKIQQLVNKFRNKYGPEPVKIIEDQKIREILAHEDFEQLSMDELDYCLNW